MSEEKRKVIERVFKCLELSKSDNPNEAAIALRQAQALMKRHDIDSVDLEFFKVGSATAKTGAGARPPLWIDVLIAVVQKAFGVEALLSAKQDYGSSWKGEVEFVGLSSNVEIAKYVFEVLLRQLRKSRANFMKGLTHHTRSSKTNMSDIYAVGWAVAVKDKVSALVPDKEKEELVSSYIVKNYGELEVATSRELEANTLEDAKAFRKGTIDGKDVSIHHGMNGEQNKRLMSETN